MPIIGLNFKSIKADLKEGKITGNVNVNSSPVIESLEKKSLDLPGIKDVISIKFKFNINYEPKVGEIVFDGEVIYNSEDIKEILKKWEKL